MDVVHFQKDYFIYQRTIDEYKNHIITNIRTVIITNMITIDEHNNQQENVFTNYFFSAVDTYKCTL